MIIIRPMIETPIGSKILDIEVLLVSKALSFSPM